MKQNEADISNESIKFVFRIYSKTLLVLLFLSHKDDENKCYGLAHNNISLFMFFLPIARSITADLYSKKMPGTEKVSKIGWGRS